MCKSTSIVSESKVLEGQARQAQRHGLTHSIAKVGWRITTADLTARICLCDTPRVTFHWRDAGVVGADEIRIRAVLSSDRGQQARNSKNES